MPLQKTPVAKRASKDRDIGMKEWLKERYFLPVQQITQEMRRARRNKEIGKRHMEKYTTTVNRTFSLYGCGMACARPAYAERKSKRVRKE